MYYKLEKYFSQIIVLVFVLYLHYIYNMFNPLLLESIPYNTKDCSYALYALLKYRLTIPIPGNFCFLPNAFDAYKISPYHFSIINHVSEIRGYTVVPVQIPTPRGAYTVWGLIETSGLVANQPRPPLSVLTHAFNCDYRSGNYHGGHPVLLALDWQGSLRSKL